MKRTRKWAFVAQEATRLAELGLSPQEIADRLEVQRTTVSRWMAAGKLADTRQKDGRGIPGPDVPAGASPGEWAATVRKDYALDATDDQLVTMGEVALAAALDPKQSSAVRLSAMGRFQAIAKQLALVARAAAAARQAEPTEKPRRARLRVVRLSGDPRRALMAVSE